MYISNIFYHIVEIIPKYDNDEIEEIILLLVIFYHLLKL